MVETAADRVVLRCDDLDSVAETCAPGQRIWFTLRPEKPELSANAPEGAANVVADIVDDIAYRGDRTIFRIRLESGRTINVTRTNQTHREAEPIAVDSSVLCLLGPILRSGADLMSDAPHVLREPAWRRFFSRHGRLIVIAVPMVWLLIFFLAPFFVVFKLSFSEVAITRPPYLPLTSWKAGGSWSR